jgi:hypothetical protein
MIFDISEAPGIKDLIFKTTNIPKIEHISIE